MILRFLFFYLFFINVNKLFNEEKAENANIFLSTIHAYYTTLISLMYLFNVSYVTIYFDELIFLSSYYAAHDIYVQHKYKFKNRVQLTIHHLLIIICLFLILYVYNDDVPKKTLVAYNYLTEMSTPFLNKSILLYRQNLQSHINYKISCVLLITTFFFVRVVGGVYFIYLTSFQPTIILIFQTTMTTLNFIWFYKLIRMIQKHS